MKIMLFLAYKNIIGNKKKSIFILAIISIVLIMSLVVTVTKYNLLNYETQTIKLRKGSWHIIVPISEESVKNDILKLRNVSKVATVRRTLALTDENESYDCYSIQVQDIGLLVDGNITGELPQKSNEILVPDWYLHKYKISSLPTIITVSGMSLKITGTYITTVDDVYNHNVKLYFCSNEMKELFNDLTYTTSPFDNIIVDNSDTVFAYIRFEEGCDFDETISQIKSVPGVKSFQFTDTISNSVINKEIRNEELLVLENYILSSNHKNNFIDENISVIITGILLVVLFITIFVAMNLIISNDVRVCGILQALGLSNKKIVGIYLLQSLFLSLVSVPFGCGIGIISSYFLLISSLGKIHGSIIFPWSDIIVCLIVCIVSVIVASIFPAVKASKVVCIDAISERPQKDKRKLVDVKKSSLVRSRNKLLFAVRYAARNLLVNKTKIFAFIISISLLLSVFIKLSSEIETMWKEGNWRQSYSSDFVIGYDRNLKTNTRFIDENVLKSIKNIDGVNNIYYQYCIDDSMREFTNEMYDYYIKLDNNLLTEQGYKQLALSSPITREGYTDKCFVQIGITGYDENELNLSLDYLIEGSVTIEQMKRENIILLPKYIVWLENLDIPYTDLQVGDRVTIVENRSLDLNRIDIVKEYTFTIGGFVDVPPLPQVNGVSNGFVAIMYKDNLNQFNTKHKGIAEIYLNGNGDDNTKSALKKICSDNNLAFSDLTNDFKLQEREQKQRILMFSFYAIFSTLGLVVFLSIFNVLLSNIVLRIDEFLLLNILGVKIWQKNLLIIIEVLCFSLPSIILGICIGIVLILSGDIGSEILTISQLIPIKHIIVSSMVILLAMLFSTLIGIRYLNKYRTKTL